MQEKGVDTLLVSSLPNIRYLSGFTGSHALMIVRQRRAVFVTDTRYATQSAREVHGVRRVVSRDSLMNAVHDHGLLDGCRIVGFESNQVTYAIYRELRRRFPSLRFVPTSDLVEGIAVVKEPAEIRILESAARISDEVFREILPMLRPGVMERDIAAEISYLHRRHGADGDAFEPIVASGERGSLPHARATSRMLRNREFVTLDFGCRVKGYHSDLTRTVGLGRVSQRQRQIYHAVLHAQEQAVRSARPNMAARDLDAVARNAIDKAGFGKYFTHSLGHGLGLHVHERPRISALSRDTLVAGNVITIEPGIYIPGHLGVRIEDDVLITADGSRRITQAPKELMVL
jgi:Xaa-Pro aminopeptidase